MLAKPQVVVWYKIFCGAIATVYLLIFLGGIFLLSEGAHNEEAFVNGIVCMLMGPPLAIAFGLGIFWDEKPWHWIYGIVLICFSLTSCCCFPVSIPLLIYWLKPDTKSYFNP
jgi:hypothetical protein